MTATSKDGQTGTASITYTVSSPPTATIGSPANNQTFNLGQTVPTSFNCADPNGPGMATCVDSNGASAGAGQLGTSKAGTLTYKVTATSQDRQTGTASISYTVAGPPTAKITAPANHQTCNLSQVVATTFACTEAAHGPGIATCVDSGGATGDTGQLNTSTAGTFTYTVTATSQDGQTGTASITYTVAGPPTMTITAPSNHAAYAFGTVPNASFKCTEATGGPGIKSCTATIDSNAVTNGARLTGTAADAVGAHTMIVTAVSKDGQSAAATIGYSVPQASTSLTAAPQEVLYPPPTGIGLGKVSAHAHEQRHEPGQRNDHLQRARDEHLPGADALHCDDERAGHGELQAHHRTGERGSLRRQLRRELRGRRQPPRVERDHAVHRPGIRHSDQHERPRIPAPSDHWWRAHARRRGLRHRPGRP